MRVPVYDSPQVAQNPLQPTPVNYDVRGLGMGAAQGTENLGQAAEKVTDEVQAAKSKADAAAVTDGETQYQKAINSALYDQDSGVMHKQGEAAVAASADTYDNLQKERERIAAQYLTNDEQRKAFLLRSGGVLEDAHRSVENHVGQQIHVANEASLHGSLQEALGAVTSDPTNSVMAERQIVKVATSARAMQLSAVDGEAKAATIAQEITAARLEATLAKGNYQASKMILDEATEKKYLGPKTDEYQKKVLELNDAVSSDIKAAGILKDATVPGYPWKDETKALAAVEELPPGKLKDEVSTRVQHQLELADKMKKKAGDDKLNEVLAIYNQSGNPYDPRIAPIKAWMLDAPNGAAGLWDKYQKELRTNARADRVSTSEERRAELDRQKTLLETFKAMPVEDQAKSDVQKVFLGQSPSDLTKSQMAVVQKQAQAHLQKDAGSTRAEFNGVVSSEATTAGIKDKTQLTKLKAQMGDWYEEQLKNSGGKLPSRDDVTKEVARQLTVGSGGHWYNSNKFQFQAKPDETFEPAPTEKQKSPLLKAPAAAPPPKKAITRIKDGKVITWDGSKWVHGG